MNDFEQRLGSDLRSAADQYAPSSRGLEAIMADGHHRSTRRATRLAIGGVALTSVLVVGAVAALTRDDRSSVTTRIADETGVEVAPDPTSVDTQPPPAEPDGPTLGPSDLTWRSVEVGTAEALSLGFSAPARLDDGTFLRVSTQPGRSNDPVRTLYRSNDGLSWTEIGPFPVGGSLFSASELVGAGSRVYALGTAPAESVTPGRGLGGRPIVAVSGDSGTTWDEIPIPIDTAAIEAIPGVSNVLISANLAVGPAGTVLAAQVFAYPDITELLPGIDPNAVWQVTPEGIQVGASPDCSSVSTTAVDSTVAEVTTTLLQCPADTPEAFYTWDTLGASDEARRYLGGSVVELFLVGADGTLGQSTPVVFDPRSGSVAITADPNGYVLWASTWTDGMADRLAVWTSADGVTWAESISPIAGYVQDMTYRGDGLVGMIQGSDLTLVTSQWPMSDWQVVPLTGLLQDLEATTEAADAAYPVRLAAADAGGVSILVNLAVPMAEDELADPDTFVPVTWVVLHSTDLQQWSVEALPELSDVSQYTGVNLSVVDGRTVLEVHRYGTPTGELEPNTVWIGTPNG